MRLPVFIFFLLAGFAVSFTPATVSEEKNASPLAGYSPEWNDSRYLQCNTAAKAGYMSAEEKKVIYILNLARMNPVLFANTVVKQYPDKEGWFVNRQSTYYTSLLDTMQKLQPLPLLYPDSLCYKSAYCHAVTTGKNGTVTHDRTTDKCRQQEYYSGECCHYGKNTALDILLSLLIDENVPTLGHRYICLGRYTRIGVSIQPHVSYRYTAVLDFK